MMIIEALEEAEENNKNFKAKRSDSLGFLYDFYCNEFL